MHCFSATSACHQSDCTASNPYSGNPNETIANYLADPSEEAILHMVNADPARTPTLAMFAKPDYYFFDGGPACISGPSSCVNQNTGYAWDHGAYAAEINTNYLGLVGPGVANLGLDGSAADAGPSSAGPDSGQITVPGSGTKGTWVDETDIRPTLMYLAGLRDDYGHDGRVISEVLTSANPAFSDPQVQDLGQCYKQLNSSVGEFGTSTLLASTKGLESTSSGDKTYAVTESALRKLDQQRDRVAGRIKASLESAAFGGDPLHEAHALEEQCSGLIVAAAHLAGQ